jgi:hypothetical protein
MGRFGARLNLRDGGCVISGESATEKLPNRHIVAPSMWQDRANRRDLLLPADVRNKILSLRHGIVSAASIANRSSFLGRGFLISKN